MARHDSRTVATREAILTAAERLFAERGIHAVSNRQISEAAGQGNNAAVGYHFGSKDAVLREIIRQHNGSVEEIRARLAEAVGDSDDLRSWLDCTVRPMPEHLDQLGSPTWYARFLAQAIADPGTHPLLAEEMADAPALRAVTSNVYRCLPDLPSDVFAERSEITRNVILQTCADRERALASGTSTPRRSWSDAATGLVDALYGLWTAPVSDVPDQRSRKR